MIVHDTVGVNVLVVSLSDERAHDLRFIMGMAAESEPAVIARIIGQAAEELRAGKPTNRELLSAVLENTEQLRREVRDGLAAGAAATAATPAPCPCPSGTCPDCMGDPTPASEPPARAEVPPAAPPAPSATPKPRKPLSEAQLAQLAAARAKSAARRAEKQGAAPALPITPAAPAARPTPKSPVANGRRSAKDALPDSKPKQTSVRELLDRLRVQNIRIANLRTQDRSAWVEADGMGWAVEVDGYVCLTRGGAAQLGGKTPGPNDFLKLALPAPSRPRAPEGVPSLFGGAGE